MNSKVLVFFFMTCLMAYVQSSFVVTSTTVEPHVHQQTVMVDQHQKTKNVFPVKNPVVECPQKQVIVQPKNFLPVSTTSVPVVQQQNNQFVVSEPVKNQVVVSTPVKKQILANEPVKKQVFVEGRNFLHTTTTTEPSQVVVVSQHQKTKNVFPVKNPVVECPQKQVIVQPKNFLPVSTTSAPVVHQQLVVNEPVKNQVVVSTPVKKQVFVQGRTFSHTTTTTEPPKVVVQQQQQQFINEQQFVKNLELYPAESECKCRCGHKLVVNQFGCSCQLVDETPCSPVSAHLNRIRNQLQSLVAPPCSATTTTTTQVPFPCTQTTTAAPLSDRLYQLFCSRCNQKQPPQQQVAQIPVINEQVVKVNPL